MKLDVNNISKYFGEGSNRKKAIEGISFSISSGEFKTLVGSSGSGKSTILRIIAGLESPSKGNVKVDGKIVSGPGLDRGMVFQKYSLFPWLTASENIAFGMNLNSYKLKEIKFRTSYLLEVVGLQDSGNKYPKELSGGMQQRIAIARALATNPKILLLDEPFGALDLQIRESMQKFLYELWKKTSLTVLLITHDMGVIAETTDRVAVMKNGDLVEIGPTKQVLVEPKEKYTKSLVSSVPPTNKKISRFTIIEKENLNNQNNNIKILNRWSKKSIVDQNLVKIQNLSKSFDDSFFTENTKNSVMAVDDVSFDIKEGKSFGLVGESGSGKTTIAKMVVNLFKPSSGDIFFDNVNVTKIKKNKDLLKFRRQIQMIFQDPFSSLNGRLKVKEIIAEPIKLHNPNIKSMDLDNYIYDLLESVELSQQSAIRYPHEFSGGQRQRISIARALATQPRLLVCDEPTSALDVSIQAQILNLLKDLQEQLNLTILFISHDLPVVRQMCDKIAVLKDGKLCEVSETEELFKNPKHNYTKELLKLMPKIESIYN